MLCGGEDILVIGAGFLHLGEDIVAGAVHDAHHPLDPVSGQTLGQGLHNGDTACDGGLVAQGGVVFLSQFGEGLTVAGHHRLVRGDHMLAGGERGFGQHLGGAVLTTHYLDNQVHVIATGEGDGVVLPREGVEVYAAILGP